MKNKFKLIATTLLMGSAITACSSSNDDTPTVKPGEENAKSHIIVLTGDMSSAPFAGYATACTAMPTGEINNVQKGSLSIQTNGIRYAYDAIYKRTALGKEGGNDDIVQYKITDNGQLKETGRITSGANANYFIYKKDQGFYIDSSRGLLKIQKFNPETMQRTGEIDLSADIKNDTYKYQDVGTNILIARDGKLFADIYYNTEAERGNFMKDKPLGFADLAVIDLKTEKFEKRIRNNNINSIGYPGNENQMWTLGDDGALYFIAHGFGLTGAINNAAIVRIKKGETDFDKEWIIRANDYTKDSTFGSVCVKDGKLYTQIGTEPLSFKGLMTDAIYHYYAFDKENPSQPGVVIEDIPLTTYSFQCAQGIITIEDDVYFRAVNNVDVNAYYKLEKGTTKATKAFGVKSGGILWGLVKIEK